MSIVQKDISNLESQPELPDTYAKEGDFLRVKTDGSGDTEWFDTNTGNIVIGTGLFGDGTLSDPSISFQNDDTLGLYRPSNLHLRVVANSDILADFTTTHFRSRKPLYSENGSVSAPTYSFDSDPDTGIYRKGANNLAITTGGVEKLDINSISTELRGVPQTTPDQLIQPLTTTNSISLSTTVRQLTSIAQNDTTGTYIICHASTATARIFRSTDNGDNWTILGVNEGLSIACRDIAYGNNIWIITQNTSAVNNIRYSTDDGLNWLTSSVIARVNRNIRFINGQFITLHGGGVIRTTTDGITWVDPITLTGAGSINDVAYSPTLQRYVFVTSSNNVVIINSNTISQTPTFTNVAVSFNALKIAYSPKLEMFVCQQDISPFNFQVSYDGTNWISIDPPTARDSFDIIWVNDFGGFFLAGSSTFNEVDWSYDGFTWFNTTLTDNMRLRSLHYNSTTKILLACNNSNSGTNPLYYTKSTLTQNPFFDGSFVNDITGQLVINNTTRITPQTLTTGRYSVNSFNKSTIDCNTTSGNIDIELNGNNFSGKVGTTFKVRKTISSSNAVRLVGSAITTRVLSPLGEVALFDNNSTAIDLIPATFFGSFDLVRVSDTSGGTWYVNHMIYDANGVERKLDDLSVGSSLSVDGTTLLKGKITHDNLIENKSETLIFGTYDIITLTKSENVCDTINGNVDIELQGSSFNGNRGLKFKFIKSNTANNVRIKGDEVTTLISPTGNVSSFSSLSNPQTYSILPVGYFGSFELTRIADLGNGVWIIDNVDVHDSSGTVREIGNLSVAGDLTVSGSISGLSLNNATLTGTSSFERVVYNSQDLFGTVTISTVNLSHHYVRCYTSSGNVNIELAGSTGNNTEVGTRFKFQKMDIANIVRLSGSATTSPAIQTPMITVSSFTNISSPNVITIIPANYLGSFELVRIDTNVNGNWRVENLQIFNASAQTFLDTNLIVNKNLTSNGILTVDSPGQTSTINHNLEVSGYLRYPIEDIREITWNTGYDVKLPDMLSLGKYNYFISAGTTPSIYLQNINNVVYDNFTFNFCIAENGTTSTNYQIQNDMGGSHIVKVYKTGAITTLTATQTTTIDMHQWTRCTYKHNYRSGNNYWLVHHYNSDV